MNILKGRYVPVVLTSFLLLSTVAEAKRLSLPQPDPARGTIGVTIRAIPPAKFGKISAVQVYFVRATEDEDVFNAEYVIRSSYSNKKQVYLLNAKPGRYFAVAAELKGGQSSPFVPGTGSGVSVGISIGRFAYQAFFSMKMISKTEVTVVPGKLVFMGDFVVNTSTKMEKADRAQSHYFRMIAPEAASMGGGYIARTFSGHATYTATLKSADQGPDSEREFWSLAQEKVFKNEPAWQQFVQKPLKALATGAKR